MKKTKEATVEVVVPTDEPKVPVSVMMVHSVSWYKKIRGGEAAQIVLHYRERGKMRSMTRHVKRSDDRTYVYGVIRVVEGKEKFVVTERYNLLS